MRFSVFSRIHDGLDVEYKAKRRIKVAVRAGGCSVVGEHLLSIRRLFTSSSEPPVSSKEKKLDSQHIWLEPQKVVAHITH